MASPAHPRARSASLDPPGYSRSALILFSWYLRWWYLPRNFTAVRAARPIWPPAEPAGPLIIFTNHPSWWDPAIFVLLAARVFPGRRHFGPMESRSLERYRLFRRFGVFGIDPTTRRGAARFLHISREILADPKATLWITAEGAFTDARARPVRLRRGLAHLAQSAPPGCVLLPLALEYPFWNERRPEALIRFGKPITLNIDGDATVDIWQARLEAALTETMESLADSATSRDPERFETLVAGSVGIGGIYDLWRRARAAWRGDAFQAGHEKGP